MKLHPFTVALVALLANGGALAAAEGGGNQGEHHERKSEEVEKKTVTGTVTAVADDHKSFTLKADDGGEPVEYRPYYRGHQEAKMLERISRLAVGDHITVTYTEAEGRRALHIELAKGDEKKDEKK